MNRVTLLGNVGRDPDIRSTKSGAKVATFSFATSEKWRDRTTGETREKTEWHQVVIFGDGLITSIVEPYVKKGSRLFLEGQLRTREWHKDNTPDDDRRFSTEVVLSGFGSTLQLLDKPAGNRPPPHEEAPHGPGAMPGASERPYDDIPF